MGGEHNTSAEQLAELLGAVRSMHESLRVVEAGLEAALESVPFVARRRIRKAMDDARTNTNG